MTAWNIRPIASALWRNRTGALLVAFQIAIGLAGARERDLCRQAARGEDRAPDRHGHPQHDLGGERRIREEFRLRRELARGHRDAARAAGRQGRERLQQHSALRRRQLERLPEQARRDPAQGGRAGNNYDVDEQAIAALGVKIIAGRPFEAHEILPPSETFETSPQAIVTQAFAKEMFPKDPNPLGKTFYDGLSKPITIVGIMEHMHGAWVGWDKLDHVVLFPRIKSGPNAVYLVRTNRVAATP
jgi:putative ABC transport system permease protein